MLWKSPSNTRLPKQRWLGALSVDGQSLRARAELRMWKSQKGPCKALTPLSVLQSRESSSTARDRVSTCSRAAVSSTRTGRKTSREEGDVLG